MSSRKKKSKYCSDILLILFLKENRSPRRDISRAKNLTENERTRVLLRSRRRTYKHGRGHLVSQSCPSAVNVASTCLKNWSDLKKKKKKKKKWNQRRKFFVNGRCIKKKKKKQKHIVSIFGSRSWKPQNPKNGTQLEKAAQSSKQNMKQVSS